MDNTSRNHAKALYVDLILDGSKYATYEEVEKFIRVLEWTIQGSISENDFSGLYKMWHKKVADTGKPVMKENEFVSILKSKDLDLMMGILINEHNRTLEDRGRKIDWLKAVENLFFILDTCGNGFITMDGTTSFCATNSLEIHFFIIALLGDEAIHLIPEQLMTRTHDFIKEIGPFEGIVTLKRFKEFFFRNQLDLTTIKSTVQTLESELNQWYQVKSFSADVLEPGCVPKIWHQSILDSKREAPDTLRRFVHLEKFLLQESHGCRYRCIKTLFLSEGALEILKEYLRRYRDEDQHNNDENYFQHPCFLFIKKAISRYRQILVIICQSFSGDAHDIQYIKENTSINSNVSDVEKEMLFNLDQLENESRRLDDSISKRSDYTSYSQQKKRAALSPRIDPNLLRREPERQSPVHSVETSSRYNEPEPRLFTNYPRREELQVNTSRQELRRQPSYSSPQQTPNSPVSITSSAYSPNMEASVASVANMKEDIYTQMDPNIANRMIRNAEWVDLRPDHISMLHSFQYLKTSKKKLTQQDNIQELQIELEHKKQELDKLRQEKAPSVTEVVAEEPKKEVVSNLPSDMPKEVQNWIPVITKSLMDQLREEARLIGNQDRVSPRPQTQLEQERNRSSPREQVSPRQQESFEPKRQERVHPLDRVVHEARSHPLDRISPRQHNDYRQPVTQDNRYQSPRHTERSYQPDPLSPSDEITPNSLKNVLRKIRQQRSNNDFEQQFTDIDYHKRPIHVNLDDDYPVIRKTHIHDVLHRKDPDEDYALKMQARRAQPQHIRAGLNYSSSDLRPPDSTRKNVFESEYDLRKSSPGRTRNRLKDREKGWKL